MLGSPVVPLTGPALVPPITVSAAPAEVVVGPVLVLVTSEPEPITPLAAAVVLTSAEAVSEESEEPH